MSNASYMCLVCISVYLICPVYCETWIIMTLNITHKYTEMFDEYKYCHIENFQSITLFIRRVKIIIINVNNNDNTQAATVVQAQQDMLSMYSVAAKRI